MKKKPKAVQSYEDMIDRLKHIMKHGPNHAKDWKPWTVTRLAAKLGKDHATISRWLNPDPDKRNEITLVSLFSVCSAMKIDPIILFDVD